MKLEGEKRDERERLVQTESIGISQTLLNRISDLQNRLTALEEKYNQTTCCSHVPTGSAYAKATELNGESQKNIGLETSQGNDTPNLLEELTEKYGSGLTMHGLQYVYTNQKFERLFWIIVVTTCLGFFFYGVHSLTNRYRMYDVDQFETVYKVKAIKLPSVTICSSEAVDNYLTCYQGQQWDGRTFSACKNSSSLASLHLVACRKYFKSESGSAWLSNSSECANMQVRRSLHGACITLNTEQTVMQERTGSAGRVSFLVRYEHGSNLSTEVQVIIHNAGELPLITPHSGLKINLKSFGSGQSFGIRRTDYRRLPPPYSSHAVPCTPLTPQSLVTTKTKEFPCLKTCIFNKLLEECGGVNDLWRSYIPADKRNNLKETDVRDVLKCIERQYFRKDYHSNWDICPDCPPLCERTEYMASAKNSVRVELESVFAHVDQGYRFERDQARRNYYLDFWHEELEYHVVSETEKYPWFSFVAEFGGYLGLLTGCSAITLIEMMLLFTLLIIKRLRALL